MKQPIRLVFSDLDGTLLNDQKQLPEDLEEVLLLLKAQGALFYTASGRDYLTQKHLFGPLAEQINFVCDNGAYIVEQGKPEEIFRNPKEEATRKFLNRILEQFVYQI